MHAIFSGAVIMVMTIQKHLQLMSFKNITPKFTGLFRFSLSIFHGTEEWFVLKNEHETRFLIQLQNILQPIFLGINILRESILPEGITIFFVDKIWGSRIKRGSPNGVPPLK